LSPMIEFAGVSKHYDSLEAVSSLDLAFRQGESAVLIGPSGCGKSTILRLIIGLIRPDSGRILFDGKEVEPAAILELRRRIGYVIQEGGLFPHLTARGNVELMPRYLKWDEGRIGRRLQELAELCRFPVAGLGRYPLQLSGGERQRVSLMRALMLDPEILLLDEPLGALDPMIRADLQEDLKRIFQTLGKTVLLVTHDLGEAAFFGDLIVLVHEGRVVQTGSPADLLQRPATPFVTSFINAQRAPWRKLQEG
jgi:osmoprotectant transport system ATP-binding protein